MQNSEFVHNRSSTRASTFQTVFWTEPYWRRCLKQDHVSFSTDIHETWASWKWLKSRRRWIWSLNWRFVFFVFEKKQKFLKVGFWKKKQFLKVGFWNKIKQETKKKQIFLKVPRKVLIDRLSKQLVHPASGRAYNLEVNPPKEEVSRF